MPYASEEKQKEFQKEWARRRSLARDSGSDIPLDLRRSTVTWNSLMQCDFVEKATTYDSCVEIAKKEIIARKTNRIVIAMLAIRACEIKHGGGWAQLSLSEREKLPTLVNFAKSVGIAPNTLCSWVKIKIRVIDNLPGDINQIDWTAASLSNQFRGKEETFDTNKLYFEFANPKSNWRVYEQMRRGFQQILLNLKKKNLNDLDESQKIEIFKMYKELTSKMDSYKNFINNHE